MNKLSNELKIGLITLVAIAITYVGFRVMKDEPFLTNTKVMYTKFQSVDGLIRGSNVYLNGFKVGTVKEMEYLSDVDSALITLNITEPVKLPVGTKAQLASPDFLGSATIRLLKTEGDNFMPWGSYLEGVKKEGILDSFSDRGTELADSVSSTLDLTNEALRELVELQKNNKEDLTASVGNVRTTTEVLQELLTRRQEEIDSMILDTRATLQNLRQLSDSSGADLEAMIGNLETFSASLERVSGDLESSTASLTSILGKIDGGDGTIGLLVNDPSVYRNMDSLTVNLNELIKGIQEDPRRYLKHMRLVEIF